MAVASCAWISKETKGQGPCARQGHAVALCGNKVFVFGGLSTSDDGLKSEYHNDLYYFTVDANEVTWTKVPQQGQIPPSREGHNMCAIGKKLYLFGGRNSLDSYECLPDLYCFDTGSSTWSVCPCKGNAPITLNSSMCAIGKTLFVLGGIWDGEANNDLYMCHVDNLLWTPLKVSGEQPPPRCDHSCTVVNEKMYIFGGCGGEGMFYNDVFVFDSVTLTWEQILVRGEPPYPRGSHTFTAHHDKDIYVFGGYNDNYDSPGGFNDLYKLSLAKMKWKRPLYTGVMATRRSSHAAVILHSHLYIIGGMGDSKQHDDISILKLINPSDRQPIFKEFMIDMGISSKSTEFVPTKRPQYEYEMTNPPFTKPEVTPVSSPLSLAKKDLSFIRDLAKESVDKAIESLESQYDELSSEKADFIAQKVAMEKEYRDYKALYTKQQEELQSMLDQHKAVNEDWLDQRRMENDQERKEIAAQRARLLADQDKLAKDQEELVVKQRNLHSIVQQFKDV